MTKNKKLTLNDLDFDDISIGDEYSFERFIDEDMVHQFAKLSSDHNPLHIDTAYAEKTEFRERLVHGMLIGSLFSALVGMLCPGKKCLYLSQELSFKNPLPHNSNVIVSGTVLNKVKALQVIEIKTLIKNNNSSVIVEGTAKVRVRNK